MMTPSESWQQVWKSRRLVSVGDVDLMQQLIDLDGFDSPTGSFTSADWRKMTAHVAAHTGIGADDHVLEVGSGAGAFLLALSEHVSCTCVGVDLSVPLVKLGSELVGAVSFVAGNAMRLPFTNESFSAVFAHSVFQYLDDRESALLALGEMHRVAQAGGIICVLDINDAARVEEFHTIRSATWPDPKQYWDAFHALPQLFLSKEDLTEFIVALGGRDLKFLNDPVPGYQNSVFRFGVAYRKPPSPNGQSV